MGPLHTWPTVGVAKGVMGSFNMDWRLSTGSVVSARGTEGEPSGSKAGRVTALSMRLHDIISRSIRMPGHRISGPYELQHSGVISFEMATSPLKWIRHIDTSITMSLNASERSSVEDTGDNSVERKLRGS